MAGKPDFSTIVATLDEAAAEAVRDVILSDDTAFAGANIAAIKAKTDLISSALALEATLTAMKGTGWTNETLKAIKDLIALIPTTAMRGTDNAALASVLGALDTAAATGAISDAKAAMAYLKQLVTSQRRQLFCLDCWSLPQTSVVIPDSAANQALPDVVVAGIPSGATVVTAKAILTYDSKDNAGAANKLNGAQHIQIQKGGSGGYADAISLIDDQFPVAAAAVDAPGGVVMGDHNVVAKVDGDATYNFQWTSALADVAGLTLKNLQIGLKIWYSV
jgi:hypothetical protein